MARKEGVQQDFFGEFDALQQAQAVLETQVLARQTALRADKIRVRLGNVTDDSIIALHGVKALTDLTIRASWQQLADRFSGHEEEPFVVVQRDIVGGKSDFDSGPSVRPVFWAGRVAPSPIVFNKNVKVGYGNIRSREITLESPTPFAIAFMSFDPRRESFTPGIAAGQPTMGRLYLGSPRNDRDDVHKQLDTKIGDAHHPDKLTYLGSDATIYSCRREIVNKFGRKEYEHDLRDMPGLEVIVGEEAIGSRLESAAFIATERAVISAILEASTQKSAA
jgi:hypothetical protein